MPPPVSMPGPLVSRFRRLTAWMGVLCGLASLGGCAYYSFVGATIPDHIQTIAIPLFDDVSRSGQPSLSEELVEELIARFVRQTRLSLADDEADADVVLTGRIEGYRNEPAAVSGQERAALNRVTIRVSARYFDQVESEELMARTFSAFAEYDPVADGLEGEGSAAEVALETIAGDIFTAATSNW